MGRPLNKKYFGNRNIGANGVERTNQQNKANQGDDGIGGEGVASAAVTVAGSYTTRPTFTFTAPTLPGGVTATATVTSEALSGAVTTAGTGYNVGDLLTLTAADGGTATAYIATLVGGAGSGIATVNFTGTGASRGSFQALPGAKFATGGTAPNTVTATGGGTGAEITVTFRALSVAIVQKGSGYVAAPTIGAYTNRGGITVSTIVLTTDSGAVGSATNQENAIRITAWVPAVGAAGYISGAGGTQGLEGDIIKQRGSRRFTVVTSEGVGLVTLANTTVAAGKASIQATDYNGNTYYVSKLTNHRALLTRWVDDSSDNDWVFQTGDNAKWSFNAAIGTDRLSSGTSVQIDNI